jgi:hypothetical protein
VERFASIAPEGRDPTERDVRGVIIRFGRPEAAGLARKASTRIRFLSYNWSLNDTRWSSRSTALVTMAFSTCA